MITRLQSFVIRGINDLYDLVSSCFSGNFRRRIRSAIRTVSSKKKGSLTVLFICRGNICRSAYAASKLQSLVKSKGLSELQVKSAGLQTDAGKCANSGAIAAAKIRGIELDRHRTQEVSADSLKQADLVFAMEPLQLLQVRRLQPAAFNYTFALGQLAPRGQFSAVIRDPYGKNDETFQRSFAQIDAAIEELVELLKEPQ